MFVILHHSYSTIHDEMSIFGGEKYFYNKKLKSRGEWS